MFRKTPKKRSTHDRPITNQRIRQLRHEPLEDRRLLSGVTPNDPLFAEQWALENTGQTGGTWDADIDAPAAWSVTTGSESTVVAYIDTGIDYTHEDLYLNIWINQGEIPLSIASALSDTNRDGLLTFRDLNDPANAGVVPDLNANGYIDAGDLLNYPAWEDGVDTDGNGYTDDLVGWDWVNNDNDPMDENGHGTATAGILGAVGNNGVGTAGVIWKVQIMPLRLRNGEDWTVDTAVIAIDYGVSEGAHISTWSFRTPIDYPEIKDAIVRAGEAGHLVVCSAQNDSADIDPPFPPLYAPSYDLDNIIANAATDDDDLLTSFSGWGAISIDIGAPGQDIYTTALGGGYTLGGGNSSSKPHVAGVAALLKSLHPEWGATEIKQQIMDTVDPIPSLEGKTVTGGRLNAARAVGADASNVVFADSFENGEWGGKWVEDSQNDWLTSTQRATHGAHSAEVDGRATDAMITANASDLTPYGSAELMFDWYIESGLDGGEYLALDLYDGNSWTLDVARLDGNIDAEDTWHSETINIDGAYLADNFQFRFRATMNKSDEDANVDNVALLATSLAGPPNNAPDAVDDSDATNEDVSVTIDVLANDTDPDGDAIQVASVANGNNGTVIDNGDGTVIYTPNADFNGSDSFTYTISDGRGGSDTGTVSVDVASVQDAPVALPDTAVTDTETSVDVFVLSNDHDGDSDALTITSVTQPTIASVPTGSVVNHGTYVTFTPDGAGTYTFDYTIGDENGGFDTATVTMTVSEVGSETAIYVADIRPDEKLGGKFRRAVVEIHSEGGIPIAGVQVTVDFAGQTYTGFTDENGIFTTSWIRNLPSGSYFAEVVDLFMTGYDWDKLLDVEGDSDGDGFPDIWLDF